MVIHKAIAFGYETEEKEQQQSTINAHTKLHGENALICTNDFDEISLIKT